MCSRMQKCTGSSRFMPYSPFGDFVTFVVEPKEHFYLRRPEALKKDNMDRKCNRKMKNNQVSNNGHNTAKRNQSSLKPWAVKVDASGFDHKDFDISMEGHTVVIQAQHRENTETGYRMREMKQVLQVPRDVMLHTLRTTLAETGELEIKGVRKTGGSNHMLHWSPFHLLKHMLDVADDEEASGDETVDLRNQEEMVTEATNTVQTGSEPSGHQTSDKNSSEPNNVSQGNRQPSEDKSVDEEPAQNVTSSSDTEEGEEAKPQQEQIAPCEEEAEQKSESADRETTEKSTPVKESVESESKEVEIEKSSPDKGETRSSKPWEVTLTLAGFDPDDLQLVVSGDVISVRGEHTQEEDGVHTQRRISRSFTLPPHVDPNTVQSTFNDKGKLTIEAKSSNMIDSSAKLLSIRYI